MTKQIVTICGLAIAFCATLSGQGMHIKPGLWEASSAMNMGGSAPTIPEDRLAKMPPEQRALLHPGTGEQGFELQQRTRRHL